MLRRRCDNPPRLGSQSRRHILTHAQCCAPLTPCPRARTGLSPTCSIFPRTHGVSATRPVTSRTQSAVAHSLHLPGHTQCCRPPALSPPRARPAVFVVGFALVVDFLPLATEERPLSRAHNLSFMRFGCCSCGSVVLTCTQCHQRSNRPSVCFVQWICSTISPRLFFPLRAHLRTHSAVVHPLCHLHAHAWRCRPLAPSPPRARTV